MPKKVHLVKAMVSPVVMYGCESWTIKKAECRRIDSFWTVVLKKTLESPLDCKEIKPVNKGNQSCIFIGRTDAEAETPMLWPPDGKNWLLGKTSMLGKIEGKRRIQWQRMKWLDSITDSVDMNLGKLWEIVEDRGAGCVVVHEDAKSRTWLSDWTATTNYNWCISGFYINATYSFYGWVAQKSAIQYNITPPFLTSLG